MVLTETERDGIVAGFTVKVNDVDLVRPPPVPTTAIVEEPVGVDEEVVMVRVLLNVGLPFAGLKPHEAPVGSPLEQDRETDCVDPLTSVVVMVFWPDAP